MYSYKIPKANVLCAFFEISLRPLKLNNNIRKWL